MTGTRTIDEVLIPGPRGVYFLSGSSYLREHGDDSALGRVALLWALDALHQHIDVLLIDTAAGLRSDVTTFARAAHHVLLVIRHGSASPTCALTLVTHLSREHAIDHFKVVVNHAPTVSDGNDCYRKLQDACDRQLM